jgi:serine/threonine-protein kinase ULK4
MMTSITLFFCFT